MRMLGWSGPWFVNKLLYIESERERDKIGLELE